ncbi:MAG: acyl-CoA thioesterase [Vicinamibacteria bacterium]|nr:acyl-CoA thioesterase [Vicinamibacteria bacterium]
MTSSRWSEHTLRRRVNFYELDSAGIVHFSTFFRYMEEAEHALWRAAGLSIAPRESEVGFPRVAAAFEYHRPLCFEDEFDVHIRIVGLSEKTIRYACVLAQDGQNVATGTMTVVCVRTDVTPLKSVSIPPEIAARFEVAAGDAQ